MFSTAFSHLGKIVIENAVKKMQYNIDKKFWENS